MRFHALSVAAALALALVVPAPAFAAGQPAAPAFSVSAPAAPQPAAARKVSATPPVQYRVTKEAPLRASASTSGRKLATVKQGAYLSTSSTKSGWVRANVGGKTGWFRLADTKRLPRHRYEALRKTSLRTSPGKGTLVADRGPGQGADVHRADQRQIRPALLRRQDRVGPVRRYPASHHGQVPDLLRNPAVCLGPINQATGEDPGRLHAGHPDQ